MITQLTNSSTGHASPESRATCPICGPAETRRFGESRGYPIVRCSDCGLLYVKTRPAEAAVQQYFRDEYIANEEFAETEMVSYRDGSLAREAHLVQAWKPAGGRLLDIGAASGTFLRQFADAPRWRVEGVEPSHVARRYAKQHFGLELRAGLLHDQHFADNTFDVV